MLIVKVNRRVVVKEVVKLNRLQEDEGNHVEPLSGVVLVEEVGTVPGTCHLWWPGTLPC